MSFLDRFNSAQAVSRPIRIQNRRGATVEGTENNITRIGQLSNPSKYRIYKSDIVQGLVGYIRRAASEPALLAYKNGELIEDPNDQYNKLIPRRAHIGASLADLAVMGNSIWIRNQDELDQGKYGATISFDYVSPLEIEPRMVKGKRQIDGWQFMQPLMGHDETLYDSLNWAQDRRFYPTDRTLHIMGYPEPGQPMIGQSALQSLKPLVGISNDVWTYVHRALVKPDSVLTPKLPAGNRELEINNYIEVVAEALIDNLDDLTDSALEGDFSVFPYGVEKIDMKRSPRDQMIGEIVRMVEARASGILGTPLALIGYIAGLENSPWSHLDIAREYFAENSLMPLWDIWSDEFTRGVVAEFGDTSITYAFDMDDVRILQPDLAVEEQRARDLWNDGLITRGEAKKRIGMEVNEAQDKVYKVKSSDLYVEDVTLFSGAEGDME